MWGKRCSSNPTEPAAQAPNPTNWEMQGKWEYAHGYILLVKYYGCTNFDGLKLMVYKGRYIPRYSLDPHFSESDDSPFARFVPTQEGWDMAGCLANSFKEEE